MGGSVQRASENFTSMNSDSISSDIPIALHDACNLSIECWRLKRLSEQAADVSVKSGLRHAVRHISGLLDKLGIETVDLTGRTYDPGMIQEVIEARRDSGQPDRAVIIETVTPTITWRGHVVHAGQIVVAVSEDSSGHSGEGHK